MRQINRYILHCSDSDRREDDDISVINEWHVARGFAGVGYHFFIKKDGTVQKGRRLELPGAHVQNHNSDSIGICLSGRKEFMGKQFVALIDLIEKLNDMLVSGNNGVLPEINGHCEFDKMKTCPNFNYRQFVIDNFPKRRKG